MLMILINAYTVPTWKIGESLSFRKYTYVVDLNGGPGRT